MTEVMTVSAVAILPSQDDRLRLSEIFCHSEWHLDVSECLNDARALLKESYTDVVLTDCRLPDGGWKDVLHELERRPIEAPPVIVVSRLADERLWAEVLNLRGYDVLATPFQADEVRWSISSAFRHWRDNCVMSTRDRPADALPSRSTAAAPTSQAGGRKSRVRSVARAGKTSPH